MKITRQQLLAALVRAARHAHEDEDGSSMVFGAITLFTLALFTIMVWVIGMNSGERMQNQTAADSAAISGAHIEAECLESIAFLNDGMAFVYYTELRYAVDAIVYSTLKVFREHDRWVNESAGSTRTQPNVNGPGEPREVSVGPQLNNPGARSQQNYTPGLEHGGIEPPDYGFVMMGADGGSPASSFFDDRYRNAIGRAKALIPRGKRWLADIHFAERIILFATPALVKKTAVKVGLDNGAEWVAVSSDLDDVFDLVSKPGNGSNQDAGFTDLSENGGNSVEAGMARRYQNDKANPIDKVAQPVPSWFSDVDGNSKTRQGYSQVRLCWNKRDWDHGEAQPNGQAPYQGAYDSNHDQYPYSQYTSGSPAGHWHVRHTHDVDFLDQNGNVVDPQEPIFGMPQTNNFTHDYGHGIDSGPDAPKHDLQSNLDQLPPGLGSYVSQGLIVPSQTNFTGDTTHHATQMCPTCFPGGNATSQWTEVTHNQEEGEKLLGEEQNLDPKTLTQIHFGQGETMPRPILLRPNALRAGVTVATWRKSRGLSNQIFPANDFGNLAIATAQVGLRDPRTGVVAVPQRVTPQEAYYVYTSGSNRTVRLDVNGQHPDDFYLGNGSSGGDNSDAGFRFGARLVPVRRELSWAGVGAGAGRAANKGLNDLINADRWWNNANAATSRNGTTPAPNTDLGKAIAALKNFINVGNASREFAQ